MCYGENGTVKFLETLADNVFRHNYSMMQIFPHLWQTDVSIGVIALSSCENMSYC
jgi:hypothetical protein